MPQEKESGKQHNRHLPFVVVEFILSYFSLVCKGKGTLGKIFVVLHRWRKNPKKKLLKMRKRADGCHQP